MIQFVLYRNAQRRKKSNYKAQTVITEETLFAERGLAVVVGFFYLILSAKEDEDEEIQLFICRRLVDCHNPNNHNRL